MVIIPAALREKWKIEIDWTRTGNERRVYVHVAKLKCENYEKRVGCVPFYRRLEHRFTGFPDSIQEKKLKACWRWKQKPLSSIIFSPSRLPIFLRTKKNRVGRREERERKRPSPEGKSEVWYQRPHVRVNDYLLYGHSPRLRSQFQQISLSGK